MSRAFLLPLIASIGLAVAAPASAQSVAMSGAPYMDLKGFSGGPGALPAAINAIEASSGGRVLEIRYNNLDGPGYDVVLAHGQQISFQRYTGPATHMVALTEKTVPAWMQDWSAREDVKLVDTAKVKLADAVRAAEAANNNAPAVGAGIAKSASNSATSIKAYNVALLKDGNQTRAAVDSATGALIADPSVLAAW
jgi:hypothetical protein